MTSYACEEHFIQDQIRSYRKAKKYMKELKERASKELLLDHRGDLDKILLAIDKWIKSIDDHRKKFILENKWNNKV